MIVVSSIFNRAYLVHYILFRLLPAAWPKLSTLSSYTWGWFKHIIPLEDMIREENMGQGS